ncbi:tetratricopeptide repeat protein [Geobacter sp. FeAm09]|uniref:tetratricopeptide repeat protein n=1 Tax=Geobacter sp. FeAm09 TaxID=2597769 RepID=UPI00143CF8C2|nr:tetratricopeptide repeat protein [Geobacter sp. FeAm09]
MNDQVAQAAYSQLQPYLAGDAPLAVERIEFFLTSHPDFAQAHNDLGVLYYRTGDLLRSLANYEKANRLDAGNPTFVKNLAEFYTVELGWFDDAIAMLRRAQKQARGYGNPRLPGGHRREDRQNPGGRDLSRPDLDA